MKKLVLAITGAIGIALVCAACAPPVPPGILPPNLAVPAGQGAPPVLNKYLVPYTAMVAANDLWTKQPLPSGSVGMNVPKGCDEAVTDYAQMSDVPEAYEVLIGCPTSGDINALYSKVNWSKLTTAGWKPVSGYGTYGSGSRAHVQFYAYSDEGGDGCWIYMDLFKSGNILGITGYCDQLDHEGTTLPTIKVAAEQWTAAVVHQITSAVPAKQVTL